MNLVHCESTLEISFLCDFFGWLIMIGRDGLLHTIFATRGSFNVLTDTKAAIATVRKAGRSGKATCRGPST